MVATCHFRGDCRGGARRIPRFAASHGPARHTEGSAFTCAGLPTRDGDTPGGTRVGAALVRVSIARTAFTTLAVIRAGTPHVASTGTAVTRNSITRADTSRTALIRAIGTCPCIQFRPHTSRSIADPSPSCATKRSGPAERPNCERPCRNHHARCAARAACRLCDCSEHSTRTKH
jgi:hypothetical protein